MADVLETLDEDEPSDDFESEVDSDTCITYDSDVVSESDDDSD